MTGLPKIDRAYVATEAERDAMAVACGIPAKDVRCAATKDQNWRDDRWKPRKGKLVAVKDLTVAGLSRGAMEQFVNWVQSFGAEVIEIETGNLAGTGAAMVFRAMRIIHKSDRDITSDGMKAMARKSNARHAVGRMPDAEARMIWGDTFKYPTERAALAAMSKDMQKPWKRATAFAKFGGREALGKTLSAEMKAAREAAKKPRRKAKR